MGLILAGHGHDSAVSRALRQLAPAKPGVLPAPSTGPIGPGAGPNATARDAVYATRRAVNLQVTWLRAPPMNLRLKLIHPGGAQGGL